MKPDRLQRHFLRKNMQLSFFLLLTIIVDMIVPLLFRSDTSPLMEERLLIDADRLIEGFQLTGGAATEI